MTTQTRVLPDLDEALDWAPECCWTGCAALATWHGVTMCGCQDAFECNAHKVEEERKIRQGAGRCSECRAEPVRITWRPL